MHADLDTLCTVVYCTAADLLPEARRNARRRLTDAEVVTLCVAQAIMGIPSDRRFLAVARTRLVHLFPDLPGQAGYFKRRRRLADTIEWLMAHFAAQSPGYRDELLLIDSTPVECARSGGHDARRPRHSLHGRLLHSCRSLARGKKQRSPAAQRRRGGHPLRGPGDHGHPFRP